MEALILERTAHQRQALRPLGISARQSRTFAGQVQTLGGEAEILALPHVTGSVQPLQDDDGNPGFMAGLSAIDGDDVIL